MTTPARSLFTPTDRPPDFVVDVSVTMAWLVGGEGAIDPFRVLRLFPYRLPLVPMTWPGEMVERVRKVRRSRAGSGVRADRFLSDFDNFAFLVDAERMNLVGPAIIELADRYRLRVGPAAALELALRTQLPLATIDTRLRAAAARAGVALFTP